MSTKTVAIAYSQANESIAQQIDEHLSQAGYSFQHYVGGKSTEEAPLSKQLLTVYQPILLLISDNFLKSAQCMSKGLKLLQEKKDRIIPVVVKGMTEDENGQLIEVETEFDRVSDIIQYINYWQDQYLDLRRQKRKLRDSDSNFNEDRFNEHLQVMRDISTEAGEFLRMLRNMDRIEWRVFKHNNYEIFFKQTGDLASWEQIRHLTFTFDEPTIPQQQEEIAEEPEEESSIDLTDIPGMDLLPDDERKEASEIAVDAEESSDDTQEDEPALELTHVHDNEEGFGEEEDDDDEDYDDEDFEEDSEEEEIQSIIQKSIRYMESDQPSSAFEYMEQALESYPSNVDLRYHYAIMLAQNHRNLDQALYHLDLVLEIEPSFADAHFLKGEIAEIREDYANAIRSYQKAVRHNDTHSDGYYRLGTLFATQVEDGEDQGAAYLKKAIKYNPGHVDALYQYASLLYEDLNKPNKALKHLENVLDLDDQHPYANYDIALIHYQKEEFELANAYYQKAISINPELQTEENDRAFGVSLPEAAEKTIDIPSVADDNTEEETIELPETPAPNPISQFTEPENMKKTAEEPEEFFANSMKEMEDPLQLLKDNIQKLEDMIHSKEQEFKKLLEREDELDKAAKAKTKTALITGATAGIGKATAEVFAENGYRLILTGRRAERLVAFKQQLEEEHEVSIKTLSFDVTNAEACQQAVESLEDEWQNIDILVNNAGKAKGKAPIHEGKLEHWEEMIDTNIKGLLYMSRAVSPYMVKRENGHIINVCSLAGKEVYPNGNVYCATKHAVDALTKGMQLDLHAYNVRVSQVSPAMVEETEFASVRYDGDEEKAQIYDGFQPLKARDVGETIFFISNRPAHVNIQDVVMMGVQQPNSVTVDKSGREKFEE